MITDLSKRRPGGARNFIHLDGATVERTEENENPYRRAERSPVVWAGVASVGVTTLAFRAAGWLVTNPQTSDITSAIMNGAGIAAGAVSAFYITHQVYSELLKKPERIDTSGHGGGNDHATQNLSDFFHSKHTFNLVSGIFFSCAASVCWAVRWIISHPDKFVQPSMKNNSMENVLANVWENVLLIFGDAASYPILTSLTFSAMTYYAAKKTGENPKTGKREWNAGNPASNDYKEEAPAGKDLVPNFSSRIRHALFRRSQTLLPKAPG
jgi:hypothetical protein